MKICPACQLKHSDAETRCLVDDTVPEPLAGERIGTLFAGRYHTEKALGAKAGRQLEVLDRHLMELATRSLTPLRARPELGELLQRLETEGTPAHGLVRSGAIGG